MIHKEIFDEWICIDEIGNRDGVCTYIASKQDKVSIIKQTIIPNSIAYMESLSRFRGKNIDILNYYEPIANSVMSQYIKMNELQHIDGLIKYEYPIKQKYSVHPGWEIFVLMEKLTPLDYYINQNGITVRNVLNMARSLYSTLDKCKEKGLYHLNIKRSNIFLDDNGNFKISDFGKIAINEGLTHVSSVHMSPELERRERTDHRSDIYSLGIIIYMLLNGDNNDLNNCKKLLQQGHELEKPLKGTELMLNFLRKACNFDIEKRYTSYIDLINDIDEVIKLSSDEDLDKIAVESLIDRE